MNPGFSNRRAVATVIVIDDYDKQRLCDRYGTR